jgi:dTDP-4-amino-4,6-dideoxygalactose transaminase
MSALTRDPELVSIIERLSEYCERGGTMGSSITGTGAIADLEDAMTRLVMAPHALATSSGTGALYAAMAAIGVGYGDEVIVPAYDWGATTHVVDLLHAQPVHADVTFVGGHLCPSSCASLITSRTVAIVATHLHGVPAPVGELRRLADDHGLAFIEDCAQSIGATVQGRPVGSFGDAACFSFGAGKAVDAGESGGVVVTRDAPLHFRALRATQHPVRQRLSGLDPSPSGPNFRMSPLTAVLALEALGELGVNLARVRASADATLQRLATVQGVAAPATGSALDPTWSAIVATSTREFAELRTALTTAGIDACRAGLPGVIPVEHGMRVASARRRWPNAVRRAEQAFRARLVN